MQGGALPSPGPFLSIQRAICSKLHRMQIVADTHVHLYPVYDLRAQFDAAHRNLSASAPAADQRILCLAERAGQHLFAALASGALRVEGWTVSTTEDSEGLRVSSSGRTLYLLAGRQIVTAERLEVLALGRDHEVPDGRPLRETISRVRDGDAIPVLPWGLGKWWGRRGTFVQNCLDLYAPSDLWFADTCLWPAGFPTPAHLRTARSRGFSILHGTDPLPRPREEHITGRWASQWEADWDASHPAAAWRRIIREHVPTRSAGRRCSMIEALNRLR